MRKWCSILAEVQDNVLFVKHFSLQGKRRAEPKSLDSDTHRAGFFPGGKLGEKCVAHVFSVLNISPEYNRLLHCKNIAGN